MVRQTRHPFNFKNEEMLDFSLSETNNTLNAALRDVRIIMGLGGVCRYVPLRIGTVQKIKPDATECSNPSDTHEIIGYVSMGDESDAGQAIKIAKAGQLTWGALSTQERADVLLRAAQLLREQRYFFIALMMLEVGKGRLDGDGEVAEAIDFLEYYGRCAPWLEKLAQKTLVQISNERNILNFIPLGVGVSIQPWNFPLSLSLGPTAAALVMGNAVVYKPSTVSPLTGYYMVKLLRDAGVPADVLHYLPSPGGSVGNYLVEHPLVDFIAFTGSERVGHDIEYKVAMYNDNARSLPAHKQHKKRVPTIEMGGKGFMIIDSDATVAEAVSAAIASAFSFQGQKCSALTRVIIVGDERRYQKVVGGLSEAVRSIKIGSPEDPNNFMGPMAGFAQYNTVKNYMEFAEQEGIILARGSVPDNLKTRGYFLPPILVGNVDKDARIAQDEIFGPVLVVFHVVTFEEAIKLANYTKYGLTGGVFTNRRIHKRMVRASVDVGNLYINRKITGAVVAQQPFGGLKMSGNGSKAGGWDYLLRFVNVKVTCERI